MGEVILTAVKAADDLCPIPGFDLPSNCVGKVRAVHADVRSIATG